MGMRGEHRRIEQRRTARAGMRSGDDAAQRCPALPAVRQQRHAVRALVHPRPAPRRSPRGAVARAPGDGEVDPEEEGDEEAIGETTSAGETFIF